MSKKNISCRILLAIPSFQDPYSPGQQDKIGPLVRLLKEESFDQVILLGLQLWKLNAFLTEQYIRTHWSSIQVDRHVLPITNISIYKDIFYNLKEALNKYQHLFKTSNHEVAFLLPPSTCDRLLDCWLLLATSLHIETKIFQMESHYSLEGVYSEDVWNKSLDWLAEVPKEFRDCVVDKTICSVQSLNSIQMRFLEQMKPIASSLLLKNATFDFAQSIARFVAHSNMFGKCLIVRCDEIPQEILEAILFGYEQSIHGGAIIRRKGLLQRFCQGVVLLFNANKVKESTQKKLADCIVEQDHSNLGQRYIIATDNAVLNPYLEKILCNVQFPLCG
ncbi:MAG: sigma 54-interacting transcriptional regulator [Puniceicoccales bacterium]|jgi:hypothetical protein|nr:sigma 54-interacting transcriptional regulator [Puniceicoccales bacterium]